MILGKTNLFNNRLSVSNFGRKQNQLRFNPKILKFNNSRRFCTDDEKKKKEEEEDKKLDEQYAKLEKQSAELEEYIEKRLEQIQKQVTAEIQLKQLLQQQQEEGEGEKAEKKPQKRDFIPSFKNQPTPEELIQRDKEEQLRQRRILLGELPPDTDESEKEARKKKFVTQPIIIEDDIEPPSFLKGKVPKIEPMSPRDWYFHYYATCNPHSKVEEMGQTFKNFYYDLHDATLYDYYPVRKVKTEDETKKDETKKDEIKKRDNDRIGRILIGPNKIPDPYYKERSKDGKLYDESGREIKINENTGMVIPPHISDINEFINTDEHSAGYKKKKLRLTSVKQEQNLRRLRKFRNLALLKMGMYGEITFKRENLPAFVEELKKVWDYVNNPKPDQVRSGMAIINNSLEIKVVYKTGDPLRLWLANKKFFKEHPDKTYLSLALIFLVLLFASLGLALFDQLVNDHSEEKDKEKPYFRARLLSSASYVAAGFATTFLFTRHGLTLLPSFTRLQILLMGVATVIPFAGFLAIAESNWPRDSGLGKFYIAMAYSFFAGMGIASHTLRRGPGLLRLLAPLALTGTAFATSLAISPYSFNLEFGTPLAVYSAALAGHLFSLAVFPPYKNYARASLSAVIPFVFASVLLAQQQPYLNHIKFNPDYYGVNAFNDIAVSALYSTFFVPLKLFDGGYKYYHDRRRFYEEFHFQLPLEFEEQNQLSVPS